MELLKKLIRFPLNLVGLQIVNKHSLVAQEQNELNLINKCNFFYKKYLEQLYDKLSDAEQLQFFELKYGGYISNLKPTSKSLGGKAPKKDVYFTGGDRMSVIFNNYSQKYSQYLEPLRHSKKSLKILEIGILSGIGLAVWDEYFERKKIYGFDSDLGNFENNKNNLVCKGAFKNELPILKFYDQFADNSVTLRDTFGEEKIDVIIDDAFHSDESIINTFDELVPYFSESFVYFIEDNKTAWKTLLSNYPQYNFDYNGNELTVVTNRIKKSSSL